MPCLALSFPLVHIMARWESVALSDSDGGGEENYSGKRSVGWKGRVRGGETGRGRGLLRRGGG